MSSKLSHKKVRAIFCPVTILVVKLVGVFHSWCKLTRDYWLESVDTWKLGFDTCYVCDSHLLSIRTFLSSSVRLNSLFHHGRSCSTRIKNCMSGYKLIAILIHVQFITGRLQCAIIERGGVDLLGIVQEIQGKNSLMCLKVKWTCQNQRKDGDHWHARVSHARLVGFVIAVA